MSKKAAGVTTPISSRELELICKARHIAGKLEGLREAAEMLAKLMSDTDFEYTDNPSSVRQMVEDKQAELNARIAELEGQKP